MPEFIMAGELKNILVNRILDRALADVAGLASGRMIDIGCGLKPYRGLFAAHVDEHIGVEHESSPHGLACADIVASAYELPIEDASFDTVLCTEVLEHLEEPVEAVTEATRVLRPGGVAIYTVPLIWHLHEEPRDFFRFTRHGIRHVFERAGLDVEEIRPLGGFWTTFGQMLAYYIYRFRRGPLRWLGIIDFAALLIQAMAVLLDRLDRAEAWTFGYLVLGRRRQDGST
jgi:SAM-dependent methyltransferase